MTRSRSLSNVHGAGGLDWGFVIGLVMVLRACVGLGEREWEWRGGRELRGTEAGSSAGRALGGFFFGGGRVLVEFGCGQGALLWVGLDLV